MLLSLMLNVVPIMGRLMLAVPVFLGAIAQRSISAEITLVSSSSLVMHPTRVMLPLPVIVNPPTPHLTN